MAYVVAVEDIFTSAGVKAHNKGDMVPVENVERNGWQDFVAKPTTAAAKEVLKDK